MMIDDENIDLGSCCTCGKKDQSCRNIIMLQKKAKNPEGASWGCVVCHVWSGAVAVLCDGCVEKNAEIKFACDGDPKDDKRIPIEEITEPFDHDYSHHPEMGWFVRN